MANMTFLMTAITRVSALEGSNSVEADWWPSMQDHPGAKGFPLNPGGKANLMMSSSSSKDVLSCRCASMQLQWCLLCTQMRPSGWASQCTPGLQC